MPEAMPHPAEIDAKTIGLCVHDHCPLDGPHWHGGIWRSGHMRSVIPPASPK